mmetsp:Transcript_119883/g.334457  ORF Transcript_119883/g.334457 Transcript_119883/m.334457 type:complete len:206 (-) Transcript_119883:764-1381(-)
MERGRIPLQGPPEDYGSVYVGLLVLAGICHDAQEVLLLGVFGRVWRMDPLPGLSGRGCGALQRDLHLEDVCAAGALQPDVVDEDLAPLAALGVPDAYVHDLPSVLLAYSARLGREAVGVQSAFGGTEHLVVRRAEHVESGARVRPAAALQLHLGCLPRQVESDGSRVALAEVVAHREVAGAVHAGDAGVPAHLRDPWHVADQGLA